MLQDPNLYSKIVNGGFFATGFVASTDSRQIPIVAVFPTGDMRWDAAQAVEWVKLGVPALENFMATPFPSSRITITYGFAVGAAGGSGNINIEDQGTYESRWLQGMQPYECTVYHELSHSYILNEALNQFLELYQYNLVHTGSTALQNWTVWRVPSADRSGVFAILDIYQLIGNAAMSNAYKNLYPINPPYAGPLSQQCQQAFVDQAPSNLKTQVAALAARIYP